MSYKLLGLVVLGVLVTQSYAQKKMFCYYNSEAQYRDGIGKFLPENIDANLCSHIVYSFANVSGLELTNTNWNDQTPGGLYERTMALKEINPDLKILLAVGGWEIGSEPFVELANSWQSRNQFAQNVVRYLRRYGFDGLDMDWEFPGTRGSPVGDKWKFTDLMRQLQREFRLEADRTGREKLLLTLAAASGTFYIDQSYQPTELVKVLDYMLLMSYNYHGNWENTTGHHTGLKPNRIDRGNKRELNIEWSVNYWLNQGMPRDRLIMGLGSYGMSYTLNFTNQNTVGSPARSGGAPGTYTQEAGILAYFEICENLQYKNWNKRYIPEQSSPYAFRGDQWVGYDDKDSLTIKANYARDLNLGGAMLWSVETDDFSGSCGEGRYPLLKTVNNIIRGGGNGGGNQYDGENQYDGGNQYDGFDGRYYGGNQYDEGNQNDGSRPNQYNSNPGRTRNGGGLYFNCASVGAGTYANPDNCRSYYVCVELDNGYRTNLMPCPPGLVFSDTTKSCDWNTGNRNC